MEPKNTLIICCDQHNPEITGCYGNEVVHTPNLDALAARGTVFDCTYTSNPICVPARASLANGDWTHCHGYWDNAHPFNGDQMSWGRRLKEAGVKVNTIGKLHFKDDSEYVFPGQRIPLNAKGGVGDMMLACRNSGTSTSKLREHIQHAGAGDSDYLHYDRNIASYACDYLREASMDREPFCLYVGFVTPHYPLIAPADILDLYKPFDQFEIPDQWYHPETLHPAVRGYKEKVQMNDQVSPEELQKAIATYYAMVTFLDQQAGRVLDVLKETGLEKNTRVLYLDDHGDQCGDHGIFFKSNMYEGSVRIPMIAAGPDIPVGERCGAPTSIVDVYNTVLDFHGIEQNWDEKHNLPSVSLMDSINGTADPDRPIFAEYHCSGWASSFYMLRQHEWKLVKYMDYEQVSLFNLKDDPKEMNDLGTDPKYADVVDALMAELYKICDIDEVTRQSFADQKELLDANGGLKAIAARGLTAFSAVPEGLGLDDGR